MCIERSPTLTHIIALLCDEGLLICPLVKAFEDIKKDTPVLTATRTFSALSSTEGASLLCAVRTFYGLVINQETPASYFYLIG